MRDREDWSEAYLKLLVIRRVGPSPKYDLRVEYVIRCHHVDFQPNWTTLGRPTSSPPKNPDLPPPFTFLYHYFGTKFIKLF